MYPGTAWAAEPCQENLLEDNGTAVSQSRACTPESHSAVLHQIQLGNLTFFLRVGGWGRAGGEKLPGRHRGLGSKTSHMAVPFSAFGKFPFISFAKPPTGWNRLLPTQPFVPSCL